MSDYIHDHRATAALATPEAAIEEHLQAAGDALYREVFEDMPIAIVIEDWSRAKTMITRLARRGVKDWRRYFARRPDQLLKAVDLRHTIDINQAALEIYGTTSKANIERASRSDTIRPEELATFREQLVAFAEGKTSIDTDRTELTPEGREIITRLHAVIPPRHHDDWSRVIFTIEDITARKLVEEGLQVSKQGHANAQRIAHLGHWEWDSASGDVQMSDEAFRIFGFDPQSFAATLDTCLQSLHPDDFDRVVDAFEKSVSLGTPFDNEYRILRPDGSERYIREVGEIIIGDDDVPVRMTGTVHDITEQKRAENALKASETRLHAFIKNSPAAIAIKNTNGQYALSNRQFDAYTGSVPGRGVRAFAYASISAG